MENFKVFYKILKCLRDAMDNTQIDLTGITHQYLKVSYPRWESLMIMLLDEGYIEGIEYICTSIDGRRHINNTRDIRITLRGLEYLAENHMMKKAAKMIEEKSE